LLHPVFEGIKAVSWDGDEDNVPSVKAYALEEMLQREFDFDAFTTGYGVITPDGESLKQVPRLTSKKSKHAIRSIREEGGDVLMRAVLIDLDRNPHDPWPTSDEARRWVEDLATLLPEAALYATTRGIRVVFKLRRLVEVEHFYKIARAAMRYVSGAVKRIGAPVIIDKTAEEWDRLARLPYVRRDGNSTADSAFLHIPDVWVGWYPGHSVLAEVEREITKIASSYVEGDRPSDIPDFSEATEQHVQDIALAGPPHLKTAAAALLDGARFYRTGDRNNKTWEIMRGLYSFMRAKHHVPSPEEIYGLFYPSILKSTGTDPETSLEETWSMAQRLYARQKAAREVDDRERENALSAAKDQNPRVVFMNRGRWVWDPESKAYGQAITDNNTFMAEISRYHPLISMDDKGKVLPQSSILREHGVRAHGIKQVLGQSGSRLVKDPSGKTFLEVGVGEIVAVPPVYHEHCQEYLDKIVEGAGEADGKLFLEWLATCTRLQDPTTALVLRGASGAGKDMLAESLARLFGGKAAFRKSMDRFNSQMLDSALIHLNEGVDDKEKSGPVANRFREIVAGGTVDIEQKGVDPTMVVGNYRVIITANNPQPLPVQNTRTLEDFRAIAKRVLHVWIDQDVTDWLERKGSKNYTASWVDRDLGDRREPGDLVEHIAWLVENYEVRNHTTRFLVPANVGAWHVRSLLQGVLRDIIQAAGKAATSEAYERSVLVRRGRVWVCADAAFAGIVNNINYTNYEVREVKDAVRGSLLDGKPKRFPVNGAGKVFYPMPMDILLPLMKPEDPEVFIEEAEEYDLLSKLVAESLE